MSVANRALLRVLHLLLSTVVVFGAGGLLTSIGSDAFPLLPREGSLASAQSLSGHNSLALNGTTAWAETPHNLELNIPADWTIEAWFKDEHPADYDHPRGRILTKGDTAGPEIPYFLGIEANGLFVGLRSRGSPVAVRYDLKAGNVSANAWHHAAATLEGSARQLKLYLDGKLVASSTVSGISQGNELPMSIGASGPMSGDYFKGKIDDVRVWNLVRTADQIAASFKTEMACPPAGLVANWRFNEGEGPLAHDNTEPPEDAQLRGGATWSTELVDRGTSCAPTASSTLTLIVTGTATNTPTATATATPTSTPTPTDSAGHPRTSTPTPTPTLGPPNCGSIGGTYSHDQTIVLRGPCTYRVTSTVTLLTRATLFIERGVTVVFAAGTGIDVQSGAQFFADGGPGADAILLTTDNAAPAPGQWFGVHFRPASSGILTNVTIDYAGATFLGSAGVSVDTSPVTLDRIAVRRSAGNGVELLSHACVTMTNVAMTDNAGYGLTIENNLMCDPGVDAVAAYVGNGGGNRIRLAGAQLVPNGDAYLHDYGIPYSVTSHILIEFGAKLTVDPNVTLEFGDGRGVFLGNGTLNADGGSVATPIRFTSASGAPAPGKWVGIWYGPGAAGTLRSVTVEYAGFGMSGNRGVRVETANPLLWDHVTFQRNLGTGLEVIGGNLTATSSNFGGNVPGVAIVNSGASSIVGASGSWWGSATGPTVATNPGGMGEEIVGDNPGGVLYLPFATAPN